MAIFDNKKEQPGDYYPEPTPKPKRSLFKWIALGAGTLFGVAHIGVLGYVFNAPKVPEYPVINFPQGNYSSYEVEATKDGYKIKYKANDPAILESYRSLNLNQHKEGFFGPRTEIRRELRSDQYTMDGARNIGGSVSDAQGKHIAKTEECIRADAGARSQGAMAGTAISAGLVVPAVSSIPYVGWLAGGWALLLGQKAGSELGSEIGSSFSDC
tara:strand:- start:305 stop:943 length:639 start_codon:yes stop_codon:yes gene_type:complete